MALDYAALLKKYINVLAHEGGSDLHFSTEAHPTIRVAGSLAPMLRESVLTQEDTQGFVSILLTPQQRERFLKGQEMDFAYESDDGTRFRGNAFFQRGGIGIALRLIPKAIRTIQELNLPEILTSFARKTQGFFLVVGPVGQGKTTHTTSRNSFFVLEGRQKKHKKKFFPTAPQSAFGQDGDLTLINQGLLR